MVSVSFLVALHIPGFIVFASCGVLCLNSHDVMPRLPYLSFSVRIQFFKIAADAVIFTFDNQILKCGL